MHYLIETYSPEDACAFLYQIMSQDQMLYLHFDNSQQANVYQSKNILTQEQQLLQNYQETYKFVRSSEEIKDLAFKCLQHISEEFSVGNQSKML